MEVGRDREGDEDDGRGGGAERRKRTVCGEGTTRTGEEVWKWEGVMRTGGGCREQGKGLTGEGARGWEGG